MKRSPGLLTASLLNLGTVALSAACSSSDGGDKGGSGGSTAASCKPLEKTCYAAGDPSGPGNQCLAKVANVDGSPLQFRISQLVAESPNALTQPFMQDTIITKKITLNQDTCFQFGTAEFNWLFELDKAAGTLKTGASIPQALIDEDRAASTSAGNGTCFASFTEKKSGIEVKAVDTSDVTIDANTVDATFEKVVIPIYIDDNEANFALLPINQLKIGFTLSDDLSCVGRFKHESLSPNNTCQPGEGQFAWENQGTFEGYITVEEADTVFITSLGFSLCVLLSQDTNKWKGPDGFCKTSDASMGGTVLPVGDWCAPDDDDACPESERNAWNLKGEFAASAIEISGACPCTSDALDCP